MTLGAASRRVASRHASLKRCRNATRRDDAGIEPNSIPACVANVAFLLPAKRGQSLPTCPKIDAMRRSTQRHMRSQCSVLASGQARVDLHVGQRQSLPTCPKIDAT